MKKVTSIIAVCTLLIANVYSQFSIQVISTDPYYVQSKDIMKVIVLNEVYEEQNAVLKASMYYYEKPVVAIVSQVFKLSKGSDIYDLSSRINSVSWFDENIRIADENMGSLVPGNYKISYELYRAENGQVDYSKPLLDGKIYDNIKVEFPTPLMLAYPFDKSEIEEKNPIFSWIAPLPAGLEKNIRYKMSLYKNEENKPNSMVINQKALCIIEVSSSNCNLPSYLSELEPGLNYLWKVDAYLGNNYLVSSEVWEFKIKKEKKEYVPEVYVKLNEVKEDIHPARRFLRVIYVSEKSTGKMDYKILNPGSGTLLRKGEKIFLLGENSWEIPIDGLNLENANYLLIEFICNTESFKMKFLPLD